MYRITLLFTMLFGLTAASSCEKIGSREPVKEYVPITLTKAEAAISNSANDFGFDVYHELYEDKQMLISPLSLSLALSMTACGADGNTAEEMCKVLGFDGYAPEDIAGYYKKMVSSLLTIDNRTTFEIANSIWIDKTLDPKKEFLSTVKDYFSSEEREVDFKSPETANLINGWCKDKTHGKITKIIDKIDPATVMALVNALYFNGIWSFDFNKDTREEHFNTIDGSLATVNMMSTNKELKYAAVKDWAMVELPYGNGAFNMNVILPPAGIDFNTAADALNNDLWTVLNSKKSYFEVNLKMPEFKFEYSIEELKEALISLGMKDAFDEYKADFTKIADLRAYDENIYIGTVKQKTYIDVNRKGTEAAAVTYVGMYKCTSAGPDMNPYIDFIADRPFFFVISEKSTGAILFLGQKVR